MRVALVLSGNQFDSPYIQYYTKILEQYSIPYDIIFWDRLGVGEVGSHVFNLKTSVQKGVFCKIAGFIRYRKFVKSKLIEGDYDKVVVFTVSNTLMLSSFLKARYKNKYVFDIRDYSVILKCFCFRSRFFETLKNSAFVVISSAGFRQWLPKGIEYIIGHNTSIAKPLDMLARIEGEKRYKILTIGSLSNYQANRVLVDQLGNSQIFDLDYVGSGPAESSLKEYVINGGIKNVKLFGRYLKEDEPKYLRGVALISILIDENVNSLTCMANRFYLSLVYGIPMIVNDHSEQARLVELYNLGVVIKKDLDIKTQIVQYLQAFDCNSFDIGRRNCLGMIQKDMDEFEAKFKRYVLDS